jgi:glycosyltransferase involved in cell wall biosynthesis
MRPGVQRVLVVVPARDEEQVLEACLEGLGRARRHVRVPVDVWVVLDGCTDRSAEVVARRADVHSLAVSCRSVGQARDLGVRQALSLVPAPDLTTTWLAHTDADSVVPEQWLAHQLDLADRGADLVLGTVTPHGGAAAPATLAAWHDAYADPLQTEGGHGHVHGANLGIRASTYLAAGGFPHRPAHEDRALARRVATLPGTVSLATIGAPVLTSDRLLGRAPSGVSRDLRRLETGAPTSGAEALPTEEQG